MALLAVDIGGSGSRALLRDGGGEHRAQGAALRISDGRVDIAEALRTLADGLPAFGDGLDAVTIGMASLAAFGDPDALAAQVRREWACRWLVLASDAVTALVSAWGPVGGAVVVAGTGVVGLGTDFSGRWVRVDGWGHLLGDAGGGAWIGARGLQAALRAADGRAGGSPVLLAAARERFGDPPGFPAAIVGVGSPAGALAGFVPAVAAAAAGGDPVADGILARSARELAATAAAAMLPELPPRVALLGGLTAIGAPLLSRFEAEVANLVPDALVRADGAEPVLGAMALAEAAASGVGLPAPHPPYLYVDLA